MKRYVSIAFVFLLCLAAVSCGRRSGNKSSLTTDLKTLDEMNYVEITSNVFGVDVSPQEGWKIFQVRSPNKMDDVEIVYIVKGNVDADSISREMFAKFQAAASDGVCKANTDSDTYKTTRGERLEDYDAYKAAGKGNVFYDFNGKVILASEHVRPSGTSVISYSFSLFNE